MSDRRSTTGAVLAFTGALAFGLGGTVAAGVFDVLEPTYVAQARSLIAAALLAGYAAYRGLLWPVPRIWRLAVLGVILALVNVTFYLAIERLGVGPGATVQFLAPIMVLVWMAVVRRERISATAWIGAVAAVFGVSLVTEAWAMTGADLAGVAAGLASATLFSAYLIFGEVLGRDHAPATLGAWGFIFASAFWAVILPWWTFPFDAASTIVGELIIIGVIGTAAGFVLNLAALRFASPGIVGIVATTEPAIAAIAALVLLGQTLSPVQWFGVVAVMVSVATVERFGLGDTVEAAPVT